jgi:hypothetical protein
VVTVSVVPLLPKAITRTSKSAATPIIPGIKTFGLRDLLTVETELTMSRDETGMAIATGVVTGGFSEEKPEVGAAFEPQAVQNDSFTEIS